MVKSAGKDRKMSKMKLIVTEENGSVMVLALMIMAIVSIIGVLTITTSTVEVQIASYDRNAREIFYRAEGAAMEVAQRIESETDDLKDRASVEWLNDNDVDFTDPDQWTGDQSDPSGALDADYAANDMGIAEGSSLDISKETNLHRFNVFGLYASGKDRKLIEMDYRKRF
jgi:hypothetical protein